MQKTIFTENFHLVMAEKLLEQDIKRRDQLDGKLELKRDNGTEFTVKFTVTEK